MDKKSLKWAKSKLKGLVILIVVVAVIMVFIKLFTYELTTKLYMNNLNYDITLHENGDMTIVETWDMYINHTNTIFKNFELSSKFGDVTDVSVKDLNTGEQFERIDEEMYHVTTGCYYALPLNSRTFEVAWGTGMEEKTGYKKYQLTYTITDVITDYKDCHELYWMLLSDENTVPVKNVTGTIKLPHDVSNIDNLKVWGHGPLNGNIEKVSNDLVKFDVKNFTANRMLEIRLVTTEEIFTNVAQVRNYSYLERILDEENQWADEANQSAVNFRIFLIILAVIYAIIIILNIIKFIRYKKIAKQKDDGIIKNELEYYRDIPRQNDSTPAEATYLYRFHKDLNEYTGYQSDMFAATILDLCLKKCISLRTENDTVYVKVLETTCELKKDEKAIYDLLKSVSKKGEEFNIEELNKYAKVNYQSYSDIINKMINSARESLYRLELVDKASQKQYAKSKSASSKFSFLVNLLKGIVVALILSFIPLFKTMFISILGIGYLDTIINILIILTPFLVTELLKLKACAKIQNKIAVLTQKGYDEKEQWKGLKNYIENYSLLNEKEVPALVVWEKYLVYATAFGIADKAIEQLKANYPEVFVQEFWEDANNQYEVIKLITSNDYNQYTHTPIHVLHSNVSRAYTTSKSEIAAHRASSGSGGGGGFSGGGGGGRRRRPEWAEDKC